MTKAIGRTEAVSEAARGLVRGWISRRAAAVQAYGRILADFGTGKASARSTLSALARLAADEAVRMPTEGARLITDYAAAVRRAAGPAAEAVAAPRVHEIELSGATGGDAVQTFVIENPHDSAVAIVFLPSPFRYEEREISTTVEFEPTGFLLPPHEEREIAVRVRIDGRKFVAGRTYCAAVAVPGFDTLQLRLNLSVLPRVAPPLGG